MDLPAYKMPLWAYDFKLVLGKVWEFITGAGKIILAVSVILWFLSYFGPKDEKQLFQVQSEVKLENSYLAKSEDKWNLRLHHWVTIGKWV
jgi:ferrous iron transport protein B